MALLLAVDFDGPLHDPSFRVAGHVMGRPTPGSQDAIHALKRAGHRIVVFTARDVTKPRVHKAVADWLAFFHFPYDDITSTKPVGGWLIDDRSLGRFTSWPQTMLEIERLPR